MWSLSLHSKAQGNLCFLLYGFIGFLHFLDSPLPQSNVTVGMCGQGEGCHLLMGERGSPPTSSSLNQEPERLDHQEGTLLGMDPMEEASGQRLSDSGLQGHSPAHTAGALGGASREVGLTA